MYELCENNRLFKNLNRTKDNHKNQRRKQTAKNENKNLKGEAKKNPTNKQAESLNSKLAIHNPRL